MANNYMTRVYDKLSKTFEHETEFLQAVKDFLDAIEPVIEKHPEYEDLAILERITEPERIISFRVPWVAAQGKLQVNRSEEHTSELQSRFDLVCRLLLEKKKI